MALLLLPFSNDRCDQFCIDHGNDGGYAVEAGCRCYNDYDEERVKEHKIVLKTKKSTPRNFVNFRDDSNE